MYIILLDIYLCISNYYMYICVYAVFTMLFLTFYFAEQNIRQSTHENNKTIALHAIWYKGITFRII